jgi:hypothetical protein
MLTDSTPQAAWVSHKEAQAHLSVDRETLRRAMHTSDSLQLKRPWVRVGGSDRSPRYSWSWAQLDSWWLELHTRAEEAAKARRTAQARKRQLSRSRAQ